MERKVEVNAGAHGAVAPVVAALGISMTAVVSGKRQVVFQTHVPQDADPAEVNVMLDRWGKILGRQEAFGELEEIRENLRKHRTALTHARADKDELDKKHQLEVVRLKLEIETLQGDHTRKFDELYAAWAASGRTGDKASFKPQGHGAASLNRIKDAIKKAGEDLEKIEKQRDAGLSNFDTSMQRFQEEIDRLEADEAEKLRLINGE